MLSRMLRGWRGPDTTGCYYKHLGVDLTLHPSMIDIKGLVSVYIPIKPYNINSTPLLFEGAIEALTAPLFRLRWTRLYLIVNHAGAAQRAKASAISRVRGLSARHRCHHCLAVWSSRRCGARALQRGSQGPPPPQCRQALGPCSRHVSSHGPIPRTGPPSAATSAAASSNTIGTTAEWPHGRTDSNMQAR